MFNLKQLEQVIHEKIPISKEMGISLESYNETGLTLKAPLYKNINHRQTAFGGSLSAVATLSGWTFLYLTLNKWEQPAQIVIQESSIVYLRPVTGDFQAVCEWPEAASLEFFRGMYLKKGKARIKLASKIFLGTELAASFSGVYVALEPGK